MSSFEEKPAAEQDDVLDGVAVLLEEPPAPKPSTKPRRSYGPWAILLAIAGAGVIGVVAGLGSTHLARAPLAPATQPVTTAAIRTSEIHKTAAATTVPSVASTPLPPPPVQTAESLFATGSRSVVRILVKGEDGKEIGLGSGFFVSADGTVVTNFHVVRSAFDAVVVLGDGKELKVAGVEAMDPSQDLAVLKVTTTNQPTLALAGDAPPNVGATVYAIGNPLGMTNTLSEGLVSALRGKGEHPNFIQTTAVISPGSSGGPLLNTRGQVIGVTTMHLKDSQNLNFAVPAWSVAALLEHRESPRPLAAALGVPQRAKVQSLMLGVDKLINEHHLSQAYEQLMDVEQECQDDPRFLLRLGTVFTKTDRPAAAIPVFKELLARNPKDRDALVMLGRAFGDCKDFDSSRATFDHALELYPADHEIRKLDLAIYMAQAVRSGKTIDKKQIEAMARELIRRFPDDPDGYLILGNICKVQPSRQDDAMKAFQKVVEVAPKSVPASMARIALRAMINAPSQDHSARVQLQTVRIQTQFGKKWAVVELVNRTSRPVLLKKISTDANHVLRVSAILNPSRPWVDRVEVDEAPSQVIVDTSAGSSTFKIQD